MKLKPLGIVNTLLLTAFPTRDSTVIESSDSETCVRVTCVPHDE